VAGAVAESGPCRKPLGPADGEIKTAIFSGNSAWLYGSTMLSRNAPILYVAVQGGWKNPGVLFRH
jgi:hypothetical protein